MSVEAMKLALDNLIAEYYMENSSFAKRVDDIFKEVPAQPQQEPVAEVKAKMTGGNVGIATVIHEIYSPMRHPLVPGDLLYECPVNQAPVGWMHSRTGLFYSLGVKPDESGLLDEPTDKALPIYTSPQPAPVAEPRKQEPVAWKWQPAPIRTDWGDEMVVASVAIDKDHTVCLYCERDQISKVEAMFTSPPTLSLAQRQRSVKPLTVDQIRGIYEDCDAPTSGLFTIAFARAIEAAHGIKGDA